MVIESQTVLRNPPIHFVVDNAHLGTPEVEWRASRALNALRPLGRIGAKRIVIVAPHPDDEVFGAGGLAQRALRQGTEVLVVAVSDGEGSHPFLDSSQSAKLAQRRSEESHEALRRLGLRAPRITRLELPDGQLLEHREQLTAALGAILRPGDWCLAPWDRDGHPDHDACGEASLKACEVSGARLLSYFVWAWHWAEPEDRRIPWSNCYSLALSRRERARKRWATMAFSSQTSARDGFAQGEAVLPGPVLRRFWRPFEMFALQREGSDDLH